jgi:hypothetical protein
VIDRDAHAAMLDRFPGEGESDLFRRCHCEERSDEAIQKHPFRLDFLHYARNDVGRFFLSNEIMRLHILIFLTLAPVLAEAQTRDDRERQEAVKVRFIDVGSGRKSR